MFKVAMVAPGTRFTAAAAADVEEWAEQIKKGFEKPVLGPPDDFGKRLKEATKRRLNPGAQAASIMVSASPSADSFGQRAKRVAQTRSNSVAAWRKHNEAQKACYHRVQQRKPAKGK